MRRTVLLLLALILIAGPTAAHHGWGNYDAGNPLTVTGRIATVQ